MSKLPPPPSFIIIGAQKSATRWLRSNLAKHPDVFAPDFEVSYFNNGRRYNRDGLDWYRSQFDGWDGEPVVGEATPGYLMWRHRPTLIAKRIKETVPDVRLLAILRNPIDRAASAMLHHKRRRRLPRRTRLVDLVQRTDPEDDPLGLVTGGWYAASLRPFTRRFGSQLQVHLHEDIAENAPELYARALHHLGCSPRDLPPDLEEVVFSNRRTTTPDELVTPDEREILWTYFEDDVRRLERMIGRDLSGWAPVPPKRTVWDRLAPRRLDDLLEEIADPLERLIDQVPDRPNPSASAGDTDMTRLVDEVLEVVRFTAVAARRSQIAWSESDDAAAAFAEAADILVAAAADPAFLSGRFEYGDTAIEGRALLATHAIWLLVRGRELSVGLGEDFDVPRSVVMEFQRYVHALDDRAPQFESVGSGARSAGAAATSEIDRLVASLVSEPGGQTS